LASGDVSPNKKTGIAAADAASARAAVSKMSWRILPLLGAGYLVAYMDRVNVSFAALQMNADLGFSATIYGLGGGLFFLAYALFEIPSNVFLARFGARRWLARIMISWGVLATAMMTVRTPLEFYALRFLLGAAEAGFFPGAIFYLAHWFPCLVRGRAISRFYMTGALASIVMGAVSPKLLALDGLQGLAGWQWLFLAQGAPAVIVGLLILWLLPDAPESVRWLNKGEKAWVARCLEGDALAIGDPPTHGLLAALRHPQVWRLGLFGFLTIGAFMTLSLSTPQLLKEATGWTTANVGWLTSLGGGAGAIGMLMGGAVSDRLGERFSTMLASIVAVTISYLVLAIYLVGHPFIVATVFLFFHFVWTSVTLGSVMLWPDLLPRRMLAVGAAAINTISQIGAFVMPFAWGAMRDVTGSFHAGLLGLSGASGVAIAIALASRAEARRTRRTVVLGVATT
jgi:ACS family tartrate transporter-like MFS transporter